MTLDPRLPFEDRVLLALLTRMTIDPAEVPYRRCAREALAKARMIAVGRIRETDHP